MPPAARVSDMHVCPMVTVLVPHVGGPILPPCEPTVLIGFLPAARITDMLTCVGPPDIIVMGSPTVLIGGLMAARIGDPTAHGGVIILGCFTVMIGEAGVPAPSAPSAPSAPALPSVAAPAVAAATAPPAAPPPAAAPTVTDADRALAASSGNSPDQIAAREKVVQDFYNGKPGLGPDRASQDLRGIDLNKPVQVVDIPPPHQMSQYVRKTSGKPGNFFDPLGNQTGDQLGLNDDPNIRVQKAFATPKGKALRSIAAPIVDNWTDPKNPINTKGGGTQMVVDSATRDLFKPAKP
jgi:uncharacterized Zn-binding protein involved in type VI secretion